MPVNTAEAKLRSSLSPPPPQATRVLASRPPVPSGSMGAPARSWSMRRRDWTGVEGRFDIDLVAHEGPVGVVVGATPWVPRGQIVEGWCDSSVAVAWQGDGGCAGLGAARPAARASTRPG